MTPDDRDPPRPTQPGPRVEVVPLGRVNLTAAHVVAGNLQALLGLAARVGEPRPDPEEALVANRGQYDARVVLEELAKGVGAPFRLGVTAVDLCLPFLDYVFGEAQVGGRAAVVSLARLGGGRGAAGVPREVMLERLAKVALHETAHLLGITHCRAAGCLMSFSETLERIDRISLAMCPGCRADLARRRRRVVGPGG